MKKLTVISLFLLIMTGCGYLPDNFVMPSWDVDLNLPLTNRTYTFDSILHKNKNIRIDSSSGNNIFIISSDTMRKLTGIIDFVRDRLKENYTNKEIIIANGEISLMLPFSDGFQLDTAFFSGGIIQIDLVNQSSQPVEAVISLPGFISPAGKPYSNQSVISGNQTKSLTQDITNYTYSTFNQTDKGKIRMDVKILQGKPGDKLFINFRIFNTGFRYAAGVFQQKDIEPLINSVGFKMDDKIRLQRDKISVYDVELKIRGNYRSDVKEKFEILLKNVNITGKRTDGATISLKDKSDNTNLGQFLLQNGLFSKDFNNSNSNISEFVSFLPDSIILKSGAVMNPDNKHGEARETDSVDFAMTIELKSFLSLQNVSFSDTLKFEVSDKNRLDILRAKWAKLNIDITNGLPLSAVLTTSFTDSVYHSLFTKQANINESSVNSAGESILPNNSAVEFVLDSNEIKSLSRTKFVVNTILINTSATLKIVLLKSNDRVGIKSYCKIKLQVEP